MLKLKIAFILFSFVLIGTSLWFAAGILVTMLSLQVEKEVLTETETAQKADAIGKAYTHWILTGLVFSIIYLNLYLFFLSLLKYELVFNLVAWAVAVVIGARIGFAVYPQIEIAGLFTAAHPHFLVFLSGAMAFLSTFITFLLMRKAMHFVARR